MILQNGLSRFPLFREVEVMKCLSFPAYWFLLSVYSNEIRFTYVSVERLAILITTKVLNISRLTYVWRWSSYRG